MNSISRTPNRPPIAITKRFFPIGMRTLVRAKPLPDRDATAIEIAILYRINPTTSSSATTCNSVSTKSPFAPVCRIVMIVEAGAVAVASDDSTMENARFKCRNP